MGGVGKGEEEVGERKIVRRRVVGEGGGGRGEGEGRVTVDTSAYCP